MSCIPAVNTGHKQGGGRLLKLIRTLNLKKKKIKTLIAKHN